MKNIKTIIALLLVFSICLVSGCYNNIQDESNTTTDVLSEVVIEQVVINETEQYLEERTTTFEEILTNEHTTLKPVISQDVTATISETTTKKEYIPPVTTLPTTESTTSLRDTFNPTLVYDTPIVREYTNPSYPYVLKAEVLQYSIKTLPRSASITLELELVEKSGNPYLDTWHFVLDEVIFYDENGTLLGSTYFAGGELSNHEVGDIFTGTIYDIPLETAKIVIKNEIGR